MRARSRIFDEGRPNEPTVHRGPIAEERVVLPQGGARRVSDFEMPAAQSREPEPEATRERSKTLEIFDGVEQVGGPEQHRTFVTVNVSTATGAVALYILGPAAVPIGRDAKNAIEVVDAGVSSFHAQIVYENGEHVLEDLWSTNGTYVNGERVTRRPLVDGDRIAIGRSAHLTIRHQDEVELAAAKKLHDSAVRDPLTGLFNRRHFQERLMSEWAFAVRHKSPLTIVMLDIDHFKRINDSFGHLGGDEVLRTVGATLAAQVRAEDVAARYGGEEFAIVARSIDLENGRLFAERLRRVIETVGVPFRSDPIRVTVSAGVATVTRDSPLASPPALIEAADAALYEAKRSGRNRVVTARG